MLSSHAWDVAPNWIVVVALVVVTFLVVQLAMSLLLKAVNIANRPSGWVSALPLLAERLNRSQPCDVAASIGFRDGREQLVRFNHVRIVGEVRDARPSSGKGKRRWLVLEQADGRRVILDSHVVTLLECGGTSA